MEYRGVQEAFVSTRGQLISAGQGQCRGAGGLVQPCLPQGRGCFPWDEFSKLSDSPVEAVPCSVLPMSLLWCYSGGFSLRVAQKAVNSFFFLSFLILGCADADKIGWTSAF